MCYFCFRQQVKKMNIIQRKNKQRQIDRYTGVIIHLFAAAHAVTAICTRLLNYYDDIPLTVLTISMLVIISLRRQMPFAYTAVTTLAATLLGYLLGVWCGQQLYLLLGSSLTASALTTFVLTEFFGWSTYFITKNIKIDYSLHDDAHSAMIRRIIAVAVAILLVRITYTLIVRAPYFVMHGGVYSQFANLFSNTVATLTLLCMITLLTTVSRRKIPLTYAALVVLIIVSPLLPALIAYYDLPRLSPPVQPFNRYAFAGLYAVALLTTVIVYPAAMLVKFAIASRHTIRNERSKKLSEQYKYVKLKQQISPHFLFNSLNILDSLVQNGENRRAGEYIRKLASLYRYILKNEEEQLVTLGDELAFTDMYIDLLKVRFADGLVIDNRVPADAHTLHIVPCGLQMLIENAIKHNIVSAEQPLHVTVSIENEFIAVANNLQPRISTQPSTRLSLKNLSRQYENIAGAEIEILHSDAEFKVRLPLL